MNSVKGEIAKHATLARAYPTGLGRWNCIDSVDGAKNCDSYLHTNVHDQKHYLTHCVFK